MARRGKRGRRKPLITQAKINRLKRAAIEYFRCVKECEKRYRKFRVALQIITIPPDYP